MITAIFCQIDFDSAAFCQQRLGLGGRWHEPADPPVGYEHWDGKGTVAPLIEHTVTVDVNDT